MQPAVKKIMNTNNRRIRILNMATDVTTLAQVTNSIQIARKQGARGYVCLSNVHMCMEVFDSVEFEKVVNAADFVLPDGLPIAWAQRLITGGDSSQVRGQDLTNKLCELSASSGLKIGLYGGASELVLEKVVQALEEQYPGVQISYTYCPPFRSLTPEEDQSVVEGINAAEVDFLFVGIGCPKQEKWMAEHKLTVNAYMFGVGAAFDFISGSKRHAPKWMQRVGLEWAFRLGSEPSRLWYRYLKQNPRFLFHIGRQLLLGTPQRS